MSEVGYIRRADGRLGLRTLSASPGGRRLLCLPFAGGQSLAFRALAGAMGPGWEVVAIDTPGHGWATGEPLDEVGALADLLAEQLTPGWLRGGLLYGHSLGGALAFELARRLGPNAVSGVIVGGTVPAHRLPEVTAFARLPEDELFAQLRQLGGIDDALAQSPQLLARFIPQLRADFRAFEAWRPTELLETPLLAVGGVTDPFCRPEFIFEWVRYGARCNLDFVPGGHMFVLEHPAELAQRLRTFAAAVVSGEPA